MNVFAQQRSLQMRYITSLLCYGQYQRIPKFLYDMMVYTLKMETNNPSIEAIMLFKGSRRKSILKKMVHIWPNFTNY